MTSLENPRAYAHYRLEKLREWVDTPEFGPVQGAFQAIARELNLVQTGKQSALPEKIIVDIVQILRFLNSLEQDPTYDMATKSFSKRAADALLPLFSSLGVLVKTAYRSVSSDHLSILAQQELNGLENEVNVNPILQRNHIRPHLARLENSLRQIRQGKMDGMPPERMLDIQHIRNYLNAALSDLRDKDALTDAQRADAQGYVLRAQHYFKNLAERLKSTLPGINDAHPQKEI